MMEKTKVKGERAHTLFSLATEKLGSLSKPRLNFYKFLINKEGKAVDWFASSTSPSSPKLISAIEKVLSEHD